jgi:hypothetical protein
MAATQATTKVNGIFLSREVLMVSSKSLFAFSFFFLFLFSCTTPESFSNSSNSAKSDSLKSVVKSDSLKSSVNHEYSPPFGLKWGQSLDSVAAVLPNRFNFVAKNKYPDQNIAEIYYSGTYADFYNSTLIATFFADSFFSFGVQIPRQGNDVTICATWKKAVDLMTDKYGPPDSIVLPPRHFLTSDQLDIFAENTKTKDKSKIVLSILAERSNYYKLMDYAIKEGEWQPVAVWRFSNAVSFIGVTLEKPDKYNNREVNINWAAVELNLFKKYDAHNNIVDKWHNEF